MALEITEKQEPDIEIRVPFLPPVEYSGNWRGHWAKRYKAGRVYKSAVYCCAIDACNRLAQQGFFLQFQKARMDLIFIFPESRTRDEDNLRARFKPGQDALVESMILAGDDPEHLILGSIDIVIDKATAPMTIIKLDEIADINKEE